VPPFRCGAFVAARSRCPSIEKCSELKPPEHLGTANIQPFSQFPPRLPLSFFPLGFLRQCALFATLVAADTWLALTSADPALAVKVQAAGSAHPLSCLIEISLFMNPNHRLDGTVARCEENLVDRSHIPYLTTPQRPHPHVNLQMLPLSDKEQRVAL